MKVRGTLLNGVLNVLSLLVELKVRSPVIRQSLKHIHWYVVTALDDPVFQMIHIIDFLCIHELLKLTPQEEV